MKQTILLLMLLFGTTSGFVAWRMIASRAIRTNHVVLVHDSSLSRPDRCRAVVGLAERALGSDAFSSGSILSALALGDRSTAYEPKLFAQYTMPKSRKAIEGRRAIIRRQEDLLTDFRKKCEGLRPTVISPIFLGLKQGIALLRSLGCSEDFDCHLYLSSDAEENAELSIQNSLRGAREGDHALPAPLDNRGIRVVFCGIAVTAGTIVHPSGREIRKVVPHDPARDDRLRSTWKLLFTERELVSFEPYCPEPSDSGQDAANSASGLEHQ